MRNSLLYVMSLPVGPALVNMYHVSEDQKPVGGMFSSLRCFYCYVTYRTRTRSLLRSHTLISPQGEDQCLTARCACLVR